MRRLPNISLTDKEVLTLVTNHKLNHGGEAIICKPTPTRLFKIFSDTSDQTKPTITTMSENKERKVIELFNLQPEYSTLPLSTLSLNGELIGYEVTYDPQDKDVFPFILPPKKQIEFLEETKRILEYYKSIGITYGDVNFRNILENKKTGKLKFCDMDNIQISDYPIDLYDCDLRDYIEKRGQVDVYTDAYMHSIMTLHLLDLDLYGCGEEYFKFFFTKKGQELIAALQDKTTYDGEYLVKHIRKKFRR